MRIVKHAHPSHGTFRAWVGEGASRHAVEFPPGGGPVEVTDDEFAGLAARIAKGQIVEIEPVMAPGVSVETEQEPAPKPTRRRIRDQGDGG